MPYSCSKKREELLDTVAGFSGASVLVIGDIILDKYIWGKAERISQEAPVVVVRVEEDSERLGGAGNVARNLSSLGAQVSICTLIGRDDRGERVISLLEQAKVCCDAVVSEDGRRTTVKSRVIANAQQVVRVDREDNFSAKQSSTDAMLDYVSANYDSFDAIVISDYAKGFLNSSSLGSLNCLLEEIPSARKKPVVLDPKGPNFSNYANYTLVKPNRSEAEEASSKEIRGLEDAKEAAVALLERWSCGMVLVTLGEDGMILVSRLRGGLSATHIGTSARDVFDVSGAGDTVTAIFALGLAVGADPVDTAVLSNYGAGLVVAELGTATVCAKQLKEAVLAVGENWIYGSV